MKQTVLLLWLIFSFAAPLSAQDSDFYRRQETWQETMRATREALAQSLQQIRTTERTMLGPWHALGPIPSATRTPFPDVFPPEREIRLNARYGQRRWMVRPDWQSGKVILLPPTPWAATYLYRTVTARSDTSMTLFLGSDDGLKVWINKVLLLSDSTVRACRPNQDTVRIPLHRGKNDLLMKISNGQGDHAFYFALSGFPPEELWELLERDFPAEEQVREMSWERGDSIWQADWKPGDLSELGRRYAAAYRRLALEAGDGDVQPIPPVRTEDDLARVRALYLAAHRKEMLGLVATMRKEPPEPRLTGPRVFGVRPGSPFLFRISATGERPMTFSAHGLPNGLSLDSVSGQMTGTVRERGEYKVVLKAVNLRGSVLRDLRIVVGDRIALTPPLGWNSWNCFAEAVTDEKVRSMADAMITSGLINHGWTYINVDDCWMVRPGSPDPLTGGVPRGADGRIHSNAKFPDMHALADYVHARGLKLGIYSSPGPLTCAGYAGSYQHELDDARQYAEWGIDYLKYDWCSYRSINRDTTREAYQKPYRVMRAALDSVGRDIVYSLCQYGMKNVWEWGEEVGGNSWRTTGDIIDSWQSMSSIGFEQERHAPFAGPGHWNDPDMLVVGWVGWGPRLRPTRLTPNEQVTHMTLWSLLCSPLLIGCDMTRLDDFTYALLSNDEVLEVNQDPLGRQARRRAQKGKTEVWAKEMEDGARAVGLFNRGEARADVTVSFADLGLAGPVTVRDLWRRRHLGSFSGSYTASVPRHGAVLLRVASR